MKYLITGGCGFLGSNISAKLIAEGEQVLLADNLSRLGSDLNLEWLRGLGDFEFVRVDVRNSEKIEQLVERYKPDVIFHFAGQVAMTTSIANPRLDFETNALGSLNILEAVRKFQPECRVIYSSTNKVYGDLEYLKYTELEKRYVCESFPNGFNEEMNLDFHSPYGCSKGCADQYMLDYARIFGVKSVVLRHSSMYGTRQFSTFDQGWIGWFCKKAMEVKQNKLEETWTICGDGKQVRDVLFADDMVNLYLKVAKSPESIDGQVFNIGGGMGNSLSLLELFDVLESELDVKLEYVKLPVRESDQKIFVADISRAEKSFDWSVKVDKYTGIKKVLKWLN